MEYLIDKTEDGKFQIIFMDHDSEIIHDNKGGKYEKNYTKSVRTGMVFDSIREADIKVKELYKS